MAVPVQINADPLRYIDRSGLVEWDSTRTGGEIFFGFGAGVHYFQLVSECIDGVKAEARVLFVGSGMGAALGYTTIPISIDRRLKFHDFKQTPDPTVFRGQAGMLTIGASFAPASQEIKRIRLGSAEYNAGSGNGISGGIELGAFVMTGSSTVLSSRIRECCS